MWEERRGNQNRRETERKEKGKNEKRKGGEEPEQTSRKE